MLLYSGVSCTANMPLNNTSSTSNSSMPVRVIIITLSMYVQYDELSSHHSFWLSLYFNCKPLVTHYQILRFESNF